MTATTGHAPPSPPQVGGDDRPPPGQRPTRPQVVTGAVLTTVGMLWLLHVVGVPLRWELILPGSVIVVGLAVLFGGRSEVTHGLVPLGVVLAVLAFFATAVPLAPSFDAGERDLRVTDLADLAESYELGAGELTLDLRGLDLPTGTTDVEVSVGMGQLLVQVPGDVTVVVDAQVGAGQLVAFGTRVEGIGAQREVREPGDPGAGTLAIQANVGLGQLEVTR